jgi:nucleotide-binding universal stress UspA family protein
MLHETPFSTLTAFTDGSAARVAHGPVVLATHGAAATDSTARAARACAARLGSIVHAVAVLPPAAIATMAEAMSPPPELEEERRADVERTVTERLWSVFGPGDPWSVEVRTGDPARVIAAVARERRAELIVVGAGRRGIVGRVLGHEVAPQVLRRASAPVLVVDPESATSFQHAVIGIDFGAASIRAAQIALALLEASADCSGRVTLVFVQPPLGAPTGIAAPVVHGPAHIDAMFARLLHLLRPYVSGGVTVDTRLRTGDVVECLHETAAEIGAGLIAVGTHGPDWFERLFVGSVAADALRRPGRSVLVAPPPGAAERVRLELRVARQVTLDRPGDWAGALDAFTQRNAGRPVRLEVSGPELDGLVMEAQGHRFRGATHDAHEGGLAIMLGDQGDPTRHLTHGMRDVRSLEIVGETARHDRALLLELANGEAVLTFTD